MHKLISAAALATAGVMISTVGTAGAANAATSPTASASRWLSAQLTNGLVHNSLYNIDDYGLTADTALAINELGGHRSKVAAARKALAANIDNWIRGGTTTDLYAGSVAKATVLAEKLGANPKKFGGENLVTLLEGTVSTAPATKGRIQDTSSYGDYANTIGQALAAEALSVAAPRKAGPVVGYLLQQQCSTGYFRLYFAAPTAPQGCDAGSPATTSAPDPDATSTALRALEGLRQTHRVVKAEKKAVRWLLKQQLGNGSFVGGSSTATPNANSTGLAASALAAAGQCKPARKAARWVAKLQVGPSATGPLAGQKGAIAYDAAAFTAAQVAGITAATQDQWRRASAQASPGLVDAANCA